MHHGTGYVSEEMGSRTRRVGEEEDEGRRKAGRRFPHYPVLLSSPLLSIGPENFTDDNPYAPQKYGRANEATPAKWTAEYKDLHAPLTGPIAEKLIEGAAITQLKVEKPDPVAAAVSNGDGEHATDEKKRKRGKSEGIAGESAEDKAERKRVKQEKKEKKEAKKSKKSKTEADASE